MSLAWPWLGRPLTKGNQWKCWDPALGPNVVGLLVLLSPNIWPTQSLTGWYLVTWLVGWPIAAHKLAGWLTTYCTKYQPHPSPKERHAVVMCMTTLVTKPVVRWTPRKPSSGQEQYYVVSGWLSVRHPPSRDIW